LKLAIFVSYSIPSCSTHHPLLTNQISFKLEKHFCGQLGRLIRTDRHWERLYYIDSEDGQESSTYWCL